MKKIKEMCIFSDRYPAQDEPVYPFVGELVKAVSTKGVKCTVISGGRKNENWKDYDFAGNVINVYQAPIPSFGLRRIGPNALTYYYRDWKFRKLFENSKCHPDAIYAHFWHTGIAAAKIAHKKSIPLFVATGESNICVQELYDEKIIERYKKSVNGLISVSSKNLIESLKLNLIEKEKTIVVPNAINNSVFKQLDKFNCRKRLGFSEDDFIVAFVGAFIDRKGPLRVAEAVNKVGGVKSIFIGKGEQKPSIDGMLFCGQLPHDEIPIYLNAADVFVLPTKQEGCCNAIIEAMACGLPIISTNRSFNDDILDDSNSIRIDCDSIDEIADAIRELKNSDKLRIAMSESSLRMAENMTIDKRAERIIAFMEQHIN